MAAGARDRVRLDERRQFITITLMDGVVLSTGPYWLTRGEGDLQGQLGAVMTDGLMFWPMTSIKSFSLE